MAEVARRAGVGMATPYRNFPRRHELLEALCVDEVDALCAAAGEVPGDTPDARLEAWLRRFVTWFTAKHAIAGALLEHTDRDNPVFDGLQRRSTSQTSTAGRPA